MANPHEAHTLSRSGDGAHRARSQQWQNLTVDDMDDDAMDERAERARHPQPSTNQDRRTVTRTLAPSGETVDVSVDQIDQHAFRTGGRADDDDAMVDRWEAVKHAARTRWIGLTDEDLAVVPDDYDDLAGREPAFDVLQIIRRISG